MKALLQLIDCEENALKTLKLCRNRKLSIFNKDSNEPLTTAFIKDYSKHHLMVGGGFGRGGSKTFDKIWLINYSEPKQLPFDGLKVCFREDWASPERSRSLDEQKELVVQMGGVVVNDPLDSNIYVTCLGSDFEDKSLKEVVVVNEYEFNKRVFTNSAINALSSVTTKPIKKVTGDANSLWKLLSARDVGSIIQGLELASAFPEQIDSLIQGCSVDKSGALVRSKRFDVSGPALIFLDLALLGLLSMAPDESNTGKLKKTIRALNITVAAVPKLIGFTALESLSIKFSTEIPLGDLSNFGPLPRLKNLELQDLMCEVINSLNGLIAPNLEKLFLRSAGVKNFSSLADNKNLVSVDLSSNDNVKNIDFLANSAKSLQELVLSSCSKLKSIEALKGATLLRKLSLDGCPALESLKPLAACKEFDYFSVDWSNLKSLEGLENITLRNASINLGISIKSSVLLRDLINLRVPVADGKSQISGFTIEKN